MVYLKVIRSCFPRAKCNLGCLSLLNVKLFSIGKISFFSESSCELFLASFTKRDGSTLLITIFNPKYKCVKKVVFSIACDQRGCAIKYMRKVQ